jgi:ferredoxin
MFELQDDGLAHVKRAGEVPTELEDAVLDAQAQCVGECIYVDR